jgi:hypothetical protein
MVRVKTVAPAACNDPGICIPQSDSYFFLISRTLSVFWINLRCHQGIHNKNRTPQHVVKTKFTGGTKLIVYYIKPF